MTGVGIEHKRHATPSLNTARLYFPPPALARLFHIAVERDTRSVMLGATQRTNIYPASPLPSLSWILEGQLHMVSAEAHAPPPTLSKPLAPFVFSGPFRKPAASWSPGPIRAVMVSFYPDALARLWGIRLQDYVNTVVPAEQVLPADAMEALSTVAAAEAPIDALEAVLASLWSDTPASTQIAGVTDWLASLTPPAPLTRIGVGLRQIQRRIKSMTGQSRRDLELYARIETAFAYANRHGDDLAAIAASTGYSDQSHLGREVKRVTGLSALQLRDRISRDEAFWLYRLLDEGYRSR